MKPFQSIIVFCLSALMLSSFASSSFGMYRRGSLVDALLPPGTRVPDNKVLEHIEQASELIEAAQNRRTGQVLSPKQVDTAHALERAGWGDGHHPSAATMQRRGDERRAAERRQNNAHAGASPQTARTRIPASEPDRQVTKFKSEREMLRAATEFRDASPPSKAAALKFHDAVNHAAKAYIEAPGNETATALHNVICTACAPGLLKRYSTANTQMWPGKPRKRGGAFPKDVYYRLGYIPDAGTNGDLMLVRGNRLDVDTATNHIFLTSDGFRLRIELPGGQQADYQFKQPLKKEMSFTVSTTAGDLPSHHTFTKTSNEVKNLSDFNMLMGSSHKLERRFLRGWTSPTQREAQEEAARAARLARRQQKRQQKS